MSDFWLRLDRQLMSQTPLLFTSLRAPASSASLRSAEEAFGLPLPREVRDAYLRHDGSTRSREIPARDNLFGEFRWISLEEAMALWRSNVQWYEESKDDENLYPDDAFGNHGAVRLGAPRPGWFPIGASGSWALYVDLDPGPAGRAGQLTACYLDGGVALFAPSLAHYLEHLLLGLEQGRVFYDERNLCWVDRRTGRGFSVLPDVG